MRIRIECSAGVRDLIDSLRKYGENVDGLCKQVLKDAADEGVRIAKPLTPVEPEDGGQLRDSIRSGRAIRISSGTISCAIIAGGKPLEDFVRAHGHHGYNVYAVVQHEDSTLKHAVGGPKFIERAAYQVAPTIPNRLLAVLPDLP
jgi:hypothetical protein